MTIKYTVFETPIGIFLIASTDSGLCRVDVNVREDDFVAGMKMRTEHVPIREDSAFHKIKREIEDYFRGRTVEFNFEIDFICGTEFQKSVWRVLQKIPYGETRSYKWVAREVGKETAVRAVGSAVGANPISIIIPCHRVINEDGRIGGFGGGIPMKLRLLELEGIDLSKLKIKKSQVEQYRKSLQEAANTLSSS